MHPKLWIISIMLVLASSPFALAEGTGRIFVTTERGNEIVVLSPELEIIHRIETSRRPREIRFNADRTLIYVACGDEDVIEIYDLETYQLVDEIPTGPSPEAFVFSPDQNFIYVSNEEDSTMEMIDLAAKIVMRRVPTGAEPEGVINSVDGAYIFVTSEVADMVHVVDPKTARVVKNIFVGTRPRRFAVTPDNKELWVSDELSSEVHVIDIATLEVTEVLSFLPPGFRPQDVTPVGMAITNDGSEIFITLGRANHIARVNVSSRKVVAYILVGSRAWSIALNADESRAIVANGLSDDITLIDLTNNTPIRSVPVGRTPHSILIDD